MGAYRTSQGGGGGGLGGRTPHPRGVVGVPPSRYFGLSVPWFVTGGITGWLGHS